MEAFLFGGLESSGTAPKAFPLRGSCAERSEADEVAAKNAYPRPAPLIIITAVQHPGKPFRGAHMQERLLLKQLIHTCAGTVQNSGDFHLEGPLSSVLCGFQMVCGKITLPRRPQ